MEKLILDLNNDQFQDLIDWFLVEGLAFHKICFKSVNNSNPDPDHSKILLN